MKDLIQQAQTGDADAFTELIQSQMQSLYKTARSILQNDEDAADAIQDTILSCWEKLATLKQPQYFRTWLIRILINKCNDLIRKNKNLFPTDEISETPVTDVAFENCEWLETLNSLPEKYRLIFILYYVDGFSTDEISTILKIPASTIRTRLHRGRKLLSELYYVDHKGAIV